MKKKRLQKKKSQLKSNSPAKVNLFFRVLNKRPDGFHEIASLFQTIDLCDHVSIAFSDSDRLTCSHPDVPLDDNLALKAATLLRNHLDAHEGVTIHIDKRIPMQAGLGGGSSNAATVLWQLNTLYGAPLELHELAELGAELGSDVPFFFSSGASYCTGRGEKLRDVTPFSGEISIYLPKLSLCTAKVYGACQPVSDPDPLEMLKTFRFSNDLERAAFSIEPEMVNVKQMLEKEYAQVVMTGSGSAFVCHGQGSIAKPVSFLPRTRNWY
ncbi:MAG: 4-(cytidine 5'-diphospho)-2-C-methyl-D-erythritol kinase [Simkaniaceae bacterium]|nr:4-(cytidine 5'-diphospho)-2-C-methyl-D-erythritol kinase [Simkaniaceae bacterium]